MSSGHAIGIDVGGTKIAGGVVDVSTGAVSLRRQVPTDAERGGQPVLDDVAAMARALLADAAGTGVHPAALGVGVPELVDPAGQAFSAYRIAWAGLDVQSRLAPILPTVLSSDVRAAALAEARFGAGRGIADFLYVTIGTGVSGVLVQDGVPYAGSRGAALVIANGTTRHRCPGCGHVTAHMVEDLASGPGLAAAYGAPAEQVLAAGRSGDARACEVIGNATFELGRVLALLADALDPAAIVIGGGLGSAPGPYFEGLVSATRAGLWADDDRSLPFLQARLGADAGIVGAAVSTNGTTRLPNLTLAHSS